MPDESSCLGMPSGRFSTLFDKDDGEELGDLVISVASVGAGLSSVASVDGSDAAVVDSVIESVVGDSRHSPFTTVSHVASAPIGVTRA